MGYTAGERVAQYDLEAGGFLGSDGQMVEAESGDLVQAAYFEGWSDAEWERNKLPDLAETIEEVWPTSHSHAAFATLRGRIEREPVVKPLEWEEIHQRDLLTEVVGWEARTEFDAWYNIDILASDFVLHRADVDRTSSIHDTEEAAKAAAQADYERRIRSSLASREQHND